VALLTRDHGQEAITLFKSSISLSHTDIENMLAGAGWDASMGRNLHILPRIPGLPLTGANAAVVDVPSRRYLTTIWRSSKDAVAYGKGVEMLAKN
jgi:hypothetical protein